MQPVLQPLQNQLPDDSSAVHLPFSNQLDFNAQFQQLSVGSFNATETLPSHIYPYLSPACNFNPLSMPAQVIFCDFRMDNSDLENIDQLCFSTPDVILRVDSL